MKLIEKYWGVVIYRSYKDDGTYPATEGTPVRLEYGDVVRDIENEARKNPVDFVHGRVHKAYVYVSDDEARDNTPPPIMENHL